MSKNKSMKILLSHFLVGCILTLTTFSVFAEDTDIYKDLAPPANSNIMFILDLSGSMLWDLDSETKPIDPLTERLTVMKTALDKVLSDPDLKNINIGLMGFSGISSSADGLAHGPSFPVVDAETRSDGTLMLNPKFDASSEDSSTSLSIDSKWADLKTKYTWLDKKSDRWLDKLSSKLLKKGGKISKEIKKATVVEINTKEYIQIAASTWAATGGTPIVDALYESALYFKGEKVDYGKYLPSDHRAAHPSTYEGIIKKVKLPPKLSCSDKTCGGSSSLVCDGTETCTDYSAGTNKVNCWDDSKVECETNHPTWSNCTLVHNMDCSTTCPDGLYDEFGSCKNPLETCNNDDYYECDASYNAYKVCKQQVCEVITKEVVTGDPTYISPIKNECQSSTLILMSDGRPTLNDSSSKITGLIPSAYSNNCKDNGDASSVDIDYAGRCGIELVNYLSKEDQSTLAGDQTINTSTIGFALNGDAEAANYLKLLAKSGGGDFYDAKDAASLADSFKDAIAGAGKKARMFTTPAFVVDPASLLEHSNDVFLPVFGAKSRPLWSGNLKKFTFVNGVMVDKAKVAATSATGELRADAQDEWAATVPEHSVEGGGAASLLDPAKRTLLTDASVTILAGSANTLNDLDKSSVTKAMLGDGKMDDAKQESLLSFIRGYEADGKTARHHMGDIVHSKPVVVSYAGARRVFVGTNEGYLHSFDAKTGEEKFAFMPETLLKNIDVQYRNDSKDKHLSGVDGEITVWVQDKNHNAQVDKGEKVYLFFGLRRGGKAYYALDVSDPSKDPTLLWRIDPSQSDFSELGQTWSKPVLTHLRYGKKKDLRPVLIFGGGYNTRIDEQDTKLRATASTSNAGTSVYIVNAKTGAFIWKADNSSIKPDMEYSVPSSIRALDMDRNGSVDRLYFGDMGGNVWRVDLNIGDYDPKGDMHDLSKATLNKLAELGTNTGSDLRKFFYEPDVAFFRYHGTFYLTVALGSGYRAHPLNENTVDRFYVLRDRHVLNTPDKSFKTIEKDSGATLDKAPLATTKNLLASDFYGWYRDINATQHEKVLSQATTFMNRISFSSFGKTSAGSTPLDACETHTNFQSRAYVLDLLRGHAVVDFDTGVSGNEASVKISNDEIVATPQIFFNRIESSKNKACTKDDCLQSFSILAGKGSVPFVNATTAGGNVNISNALPKVFWRVKSD